MSSGKKQKQQLTLKVLVRVEKSFESNACKHTVTTNVIVTMFVVYVVTIFIRVDDPPKREPLSNADLFDKILYIHMILTLTLILNMTTVFVQ